ncbi:hypothetical protein [Janibacter alittae]|uniref:Uncharacterized protein n=1 Tax=Janibacter alittae TaxID=3115209 RepID=A0ABZ2MLX8_9MICO
MPTTLEASRTTGSGRQGAVDEVLDAVELVDELPFEDEDEDEDEPEESLDVVVEVLEESLDVLLASLEEPEDPESERESVL